METTSQSRFLILPGIMAELQEVQITEEKPLLPGQTPEAAKVIRDRLTPMPKFETSKHPPCLLTSQA